MSDKEGNAAEIGQDSRKRKRTTQGSQTDDELSTAGETNPSMAAKLTEINRKLDISLAGIKDRKSKSSRKNSVFWRKKTPI